jgi:hypothetical protein
MKGPVLLIALLTLAVHPASAQGDIPFTRAIYRPSSAYWRYNFTALAEAGIDAYYGNGGSGLWSEEIYEEKYGRESLEAAANNITYIAGPYYMQVNWDRVKFNYTRAVGPGGVVEVRSPSPIDQAWWDVMVDTPAQIIANLSLHYPIWGIVWDMELYGHDTYKPTYYSFDKPAMRAFANETDRTIPDLPTSERYSWLRGSGLLDEYQAWMSRKAYDMAKRTADRVHSINPNLSLGILYFEDCWYYWAILDAFMTPQAPVTGWNEQSYPGFRLGGDEGIDVYQEMWEDHGLNGRFLPGLASVLPWDVLTHTEMMLRQNGALWLYFGNRYPVERDPAYEAAFKAVEHLFYFNRSYLDPVPLFYLHPGVEARAYRGPDDKATLFLTPFRVKEKGSVPIDVVTDFTILTDSQDLIYIGENLTRKHLANDADRGSLSRDDIPCIISNLAHDDLTRTENLAIIRELENLVSYNRKLDLLDLSGIPERLRAAKDAGEKGQLGLANDILLAAREEAYLEILEEVKPIIERGLKNPRNTTIPLNLLRILSNGERAFRDELPIVGQTHLYSGLGLWASSVAEGIGPLALILALAASLLLKSIPHHSSAATGWSNSAGPRGARGSGRQP